MPTRKPTSKPATTALRNSRPLIVGRASASAIAVGTLSDATCNRPAVCRSSSSKPCPPVALTSAAKAALVRSWLPQIRALPCACSMIAMSATKCCTRAVGWTSDHGSRQGPHRSETLVRRRTHGIYVGAASALAPFGLSFGFGVYLGFGVTCAPSSFLFFCHVCSRPASS